MKYKIIIPILFLAANRSSAQNNPGQKVDAYIQNQIHENHVTGLSLAVVKDGKVVKMAGYGMANMETGTAATAATAYKIASVSKQFLAAGVMILVQDGKLGLSDKVGRYLPATPDTWKDITVQQVLTHTAGLPVDIPSFEPFKPQPDSLLVKSLYGSALLYAPGDSFRYSNADYFVIAEIIRRVSGMPWDEFLAKRIFSPLGMASTRTTTTTDLVKNRASGYLLKDGLPKNAENWIAVRPSGAFLSTVADMVKWDAALYSDDILSGDSREKMWTPVKLNNGTTIPYGFGWGLSPWQGHQRVFHDGGLPGFSSDFERFVKDRLTVIVLCNTESGDAENIALHVAGFYVQELTPVPQKSADR